MATTTNYGWTTPDDTDLVKDGAAAIRTLGSSIDTSFAADEGDLLVGGTSDIFEALPIGAAGTVLTSDGDTAEWVAPATGGGMTLLNSGGTTLTGATTTVSGIAGGYRNLHIVIVNFDPANDNDRITLKVNGDGNANRYRAYDFNTSSSTADSFNADRWYIGNTQDDGVNTGITWIDIYEYDNTSIWKMMGFASVTNDWSTPTNLSQQWGQGYYNQTGAVTSLQFGAQNGNLNAGTVYVYGVK